MDLGDIGQIGIAKKYTPVKSSNKPQERYHPVKYPRFR